MKKIRQIGFSLFAVLIMVSCADNTIKEKTIKATAISISGDGSNYFKVVDGNYIFKVIKDDVIVGITLELIKEYEGTKDPKMYNISLVPLDKSGVALPGLEVDFYPATESDRDKVNDLLESKVGKRVSISFQWSYYSDEKRIIKQIMNDVENFEITRTEITIDETANVNASVVSAPAEEKEDWDKVLKSYESYIDQYIKLLKKASTGDATALSDYPAMMEKATDLSDKLDKASDNMSPAQLAKFMKLQTKLVEAASTL